MHDLVQSGGDQEVPLLFLNIVCLRDCILIEESLLFLLFQVIATCGFPWGVQCCIDYYVTVPACQTGLN